MGLNFLIQDLSINLLFHYVGRIFCLQEHIDVFVPCCLGDIGGSEQNEYFCSGVEYRPNMFILLLIQNPSFLSIQGVMTSSDYKIAICKRHSDIAHFTSYTEFLSTLSIIIC